MEEQSYDGMSCRNKGFQQEGPSLSDLLPTTWFQSHLHQNQDCPNQTAQVIPPPHHPPTPFFSCQLFSTKFLRNFNWKLVMEIWITISFPSYFFSCCVPNPLWYKRVPCPGTYLSSAKVLGLRVVQAWPDRELPQARRAVDGRRLCRGGSILHHWHLPTPENSNVWTKSVTQKNHDHDSSKLWEVKVALLLELTAVTRSDPLKLNSMFYFHGWRFSSTVLREWREKWSNLTYVVEEK